MAEAGQDLAEHDKIVAFKKWLVSHGAHFHPKVSYAEAVGGFKIIATEALEADSTIVACPFSLAITPALSRRALFTLLKDEEPLNRWSERELTCAYICFHWIIDVEKHLEFMHKPYLDTLPACGQLRTPLHFNDAELEAIKGTNLYVATQQRKADWEAEWTRCRATISQVNTAWSQKFTWDHYLTASTYLSSRAFPSTLLTRTPSLLQTPESHPVLLPGIDALNHARAQPVSWSVTYPSLPAPTTSSTAEPTIALILHTPHARGAELFNNYGPKPNAELVLGYGFAIVGNPDDSILLTLGGSASAPSSSFEIGLVPDAQMHGLWDAIVAEVRSHADADGEGEWAVVLDGAGALESMAAERAARLPAYMPTEGIRPEVGSMIESYLQGQRAVLRGLMAYAREKEVEAKEMARRAGVNLVFEDDIEEEEEE